MPPAQNSAKKPDRAHPAWQEKQQADTRRRIVEQAFELILARGVEEVKMTDIAGAVDIGVATLYRWFGTKDRLVLQAGIHLWNAVARLLDGVFTSELFAQKSGLEQCRDLLKVFLAGYLGHTGYVRFLYEFDQMAARGAFTPADLAAYEASILDLRELARAAYRKGRTDGSIRELDFERFYFSATHALMALAQKLVCSGELLESDRAVSGEEQLRTVIEMAIAYIKN